MQVNYSDFRQHCFYVELKKIKFTGAFIMIKKRLAFVWALYIPFPYSLFGQTNTDNLGTETSTALSCRAHKAIQSFFFSFFFLENYSIPFLVMYQSLVGLRQLKQIGQ